VPRRKREREPEDDKGQQRRKTIQSAEKVHTSIIERRDELNAEARLLRDERNTLNEERKNALAGVDKLKAERDALVRKMREHKKRRNECQSKARAMIEEKRERNKDLNRALPKDVLVLDAEIKSLELKQQTIPMSLAAEKDLIDSIRDKMHQYIEMQKNLVDQETLVEDLDALNASIDDLFKKADEEHTYVVQYYEDSQKFHEQVVEIYNSVSYLIIEANKKHAEFIETKEKADAQHQKALEMRSRVLSLKKEVRDERQQARRVIKEQSQAVDKALTNKKELEKVEDDTLEQLKKGGKISF